MSRALLLSAAFVVSCAVSSANAQGTPEQREACQNDAFTFCGQFIPDIDNTKACMLKNLRKLSPPCRAVFAAARRKK